jgi:hypothetical protein
MAPAAVVALTFGQRGFHVFVPVRVNATVVKSPMYATMSGMPSPLRSATATALGELTQSTTPSPSRSTPARFACSVQSFPLRMRTMPRFSV